MTKQHPDQSSEVEALLARLRTEGEDESLETDDGYGDLPTEPIQALMTAFPAGTAAAAAVDALTESSPRAITPARRAALQTRLEAALARQRGKRGQLPAILRHYRHQQGRSLEQLAAAITHVPDVTGREIADLENGVVDVGAGRSLSLLAAAAVELAVDQRTAENGITASLMATREIPLLAAGATDLPDLTEAEQALVEQFRTDYIAAVSKGTE